MLNCKTVRYGEIKVYYFPELDGGGRSFGQDFIPVVKNLFGKVNNLCEFGCGPGFIGFSLLAHGLCKKLSLIDVNPTAIGTCRLTIKFNHLEKVANAFLSDGLSKIPKSQKWDLVVSNPPHFNGSFYKRDDDLLVIDPNWQIHKSFYSSVGNNLTKYSCVLLVENAHGSSVSTFKKMIGDGGLRIVRHFRYEHSLKDSGAHGRWSYGGRNLLRRLTHLNLDLIRRILTGRMRIRLLGFLANPQNPFYFILSEAH